MAPEAANSPAPRTDWATCPATSLHTFDAPSLIENWPRLHAGDGEPLPASDALLSAWLLYHNGNFEQAAQAALVLGESGVSLANKATCIYANHLEPHEPRRLTLLQAAAERARAQQQRAPHLANAHSWEAYALARYSQGISVAKALSIGLGRTVREALLRCLTLQPDHADAHLVLASYHAEVIDKVGELIGGLTHGARKTEGLALYDKALALNPDSPITLCEVANGWIMLEGKRALERSQRLREQALEMVPADAMEALYLRAAGADLQDS